MGLLAVQVVFATAVVPARRGRHRSAVTAVATRALLFPPVAAFHGGFLA